MRSSDWDAVLEAATRHAREHLASLPDRRVQPEATYDEMRAAIDAVLPQAGRPAAEVVDELGRVMAPLVAAHASGRYFAFVIGGLHPAAYGADLLVSTWDQNAAIHASAPGVAVVEEIAAEWLLALVGLPAGASVGFVTGGQAGNLTGLAAGRDHVLRQAGWDVAADGLRGAPPLHVVVKSGRHSTVSRALRLLGLGERAIVEIPCDDQDRLLIDELRVALAGLDGPTLLCMEAGNIHTGAFDPFTAVADAVDEHRARGSPAWTHVDGAIGLLAAAVPSLAALTEGVQRLDSWSTDGHKLLNTPYDCGIVICRDAAAHRAALGLHAAYVVESDGVAREPLGLQPELSRRPRGVPVYAALASLGREGLVEVVETTAAMARRLSAALTDSGLAETVNEVVLNQALVRWLPPAGADEDAFNDTVIARVQADGTAFVAGTTWRGRRRMRVSVADWATDADDVDRVAAAMVAAARAVAAEHADA